MSTISKQLPTSGSPVAGGLQPRLAKEVLKINLVVLFLILMMLPLNIVNVMFYLKQSYACEVELQTNLNEDFKITVGWKLIIRYYHSISRLEIGMPTQGQKGEAVWLA